MLQFLAIFIALLAGFSCEKSFISENILNRILSLAVLFILFIMGYNFGSDSLNLVTESLHLVKIVGTMTAILFLFNFASVYVYVHYKFYPTTYSTHKPTRATHFSHYFFVSGKYLGCVILGIAMGYTMKLPVLHLNSIINIVLFTVLFIIGHQLRQQGISRRAILANKTGIEIALIIAASSICAGIFSAYLLHLSRNEGLILSSGFGWYTLSGILAGKLISHQAGTASFFIDFLREIIVIILISAFGRKNPIPFVAYGGATSLDFSLPAIKLNLGDDMVPIAITSGMILTLLVPILIPFIAYLNLI